MPHMMTDQQMSEFRLSDEMVVEYLRRWKELPTINGMIGSLKGYDDGFAQPSGLTGFCRDEKNRVVLASVSITGLVHVHFEFGRIN